jgi:hypothetical protein
MPRIISKKIRSRDTKSTSTFTGEKKKVMVDW